MRPTALTPEVQAALVEAVELGATWEKAAQAAGVAVSTLRDWRTRGRSGEAPFSALLADLEKAEGAAITRALSAIHAAASGGSWQAAAWFLERRYPSDYGRRPPILIERQEDGPGPEDVVARAIDRIRVRGEARRAALSPGEQVAAALDGIADALD